MKNHMKIVYIFHAKPLRIRLDKINGFIRIYEGTRCLVLFGPGKYDTIAY